MLVYRPPKGNEFEDQLEEAIENISRNNKIDIFILGDMNIDYTRINNEREQIKSLVKQMEQLIEEKTRLADTSSILDLILRNSVYKGKGALDHGG